MPAYYGQILFGEDDFASGEVLVFPTDGINDIYPESAYHLIVESISLLGLSYEYSIGWAQGKILFSALSNNLADLDQHIRDVQWP